MQSESLKHVSLAVWHAKDWVPEQIESTHSNPAPQLPTLQDALSPLPTGSAQTQICPPPHSESRVQP